KGETVRIRPKTGSGAGKTRDERRPAADLRAPAAGRAGRAPRARAGSAILYTGALGTPAAARRGDGGESVAMRDPGAGALAFREARA
ncbi:MAG: hypothetical protein ACU0DT_19995, partial [Albimonas sp.]|uniref:hypothetical protein n=1 Tax=Albimonas sp. TaxID=1872425 RepID=UPI00405618BC